MTDTPMDGLESSDRATILVVDDTPDNLTLMSSLLKDDYKVRIANSGEKALKIAMSDSPPDLILLDIMMPGMDGYEVCRRLKGEPTTLHIPVIFLTAKTEVADEKRGLDLGAVDYITKPISPPIVLARVKNQLALKAMSDFLQEQNVELERAKAAAEKASRAKSDFLSSMSHDLRSPLNAILGFAQLMESDIPAPTAEQKSSIDRILKAGWYLLALINELLDLAIVESGRLMLSVEPVSLSDVLLECQDIVAPNAEQHRVTTIFPALVAPLSVQADRTRLKQVLINLLSNAIKYNRTGGTVAVDCTTPSADRVRISVRDTGHGLSPEKLAQLFQSFNRLGQEAGEVEGTGIGLVVSKRLVELMNGTIGVESTVGVSSVFWIELLATRTADRANAAPVPGEYAAPPSSRDVDVRTLLYVEDNPANLKLMEQLIARRPDLRLLSAGDAYAGIQIARDSLPDVILMDINLPGVNGFEALNILRADPATAQIPVIALSANNATRDIKRGLKAGFFRYLTKPIKIAEFMDVLTEALAIGAAYERRYH